MKLGVEFGLKAVDHFLELKETLMDNFTFVVLFGAALLPESGDYPQRHGDREPKFRRTFRGVERGVRFPSPAFYDRPLTTGCES